MDDTLSVGGVTTIGAAETETPAQPTGTGSAAPENTQVDGGEPQGSAEGSQEQGQGKRKWSMQDEVKELRAQRRELREQLGSFQSQLEELRREREEANRRTDPKTAKTPANFWQDPEGTLDAKLEEKLERLQNNMLERFQTTREQEFQHQALRQEQAQATEFIRSQKGYDSSDDEELIDIIEQIPNRQSLSPQWVAEYAWLKLQQSRGVGDRSLAKRQATGVQGQPPGQGFGRKVWSKADFDAAVDMVEKKRDDPKMNELFEELQAAHKEGRVK